MTIQFMQVYIGSDHGGFELKNYLKEWLVEQGYSVEDCGNTVLDPADDYPIYALSVAKAVASNPESRGILICRSGVGVTIAANKVQGVRASLATNVEEVRHAREHDDLNVLALSGDYISEDEAKEFVAAFLNTDFSQHERHIRRLQQITDYEKGIND